MLQIAIFEKIVLLDSFRGHLKHVHLRDRELMKGSEPLQRYDIFALNTWARPEAIMDLRRLAENYTHLCFSEYALGKLFRQVSAKFWKLLPSNIVFLS